jgi:hypothetical protein
MGAIPPRQFGPVDNLVGACATFSTTTVRPVADAALAEATQLAGNSDQLSLRFAVMLAHIACELHTEETLKRLFDLRADKELCELILPEETDVKSLANPRVRRIYTKLTGDNPAQAAWWTDWIKSRKDRHRIAHSGGYITAAEVNTAIRVAGQSMQHVYDKSQAAIVKYRKEHSKDSRSL